MEKEEFIKGLSYLKANYLNWEFDLTNTMMLKVWYEKFKNLDYETFIALLKKYTELNEFAPTSPATLLNLYKQQVLVNEFDSNEAWQLVLDLIRSYGFTYSRDKIYKKLEKYIPLKKTVEQFEYDLTNMTNDNYNLSTRFKKAYQANLEKFVENKMNEKLGLSNKLELTNNDKLKIGYGE